MFILSYYWLTQKFSSNIDVLKDDVLLIYLFSPYILHHTNEDFWQREFIIVYKVYNKWLILQSESYKIGN